MRLRLLEAQYEYKRKKGRKVHMAVDTLGHLLALHVTPANQGDRARVKRLAEKVQEVTGESVEIAFVDQGYTGEQAEADAAEHGIKLEVVKFPQAKRGFVLLPRRWVVERSFARMSRFRRLVKDYERLQQTFAGLHFVAFAILMLKRVVELAAQSAKQTLKRIIVEVIRIPSVFSLWDNVSAFVENELNVENCAMKANLLVHRSSRS